MRSFLVAVFLCLASVVSAGELYITGSIGQSRFDPTVPDGTWKQEGLGYQFTKQDFAWKAGLGYRMGDWSVEGNYVHFGAVKMYGGAVDDRGYDPVAHRPLPGWDQHKFEGQDAIQGGSLILKRSFHIGELSPYVGAGIWGGSHTVSWVAWGHPSHGNAHRTPEYSLTGMLVGPTVTGGVCYRWICGQVDYYRAVSQSQFPISTSIIMPTFTVQIPVF